MPRDADKKDSGLDTGHQAAVASSSESACEQWCPNSPGAAVTPGGGEEWPCRGECCQGLSRKAPELVLQKEKAKSTAGGTAGFVLLCRGTPGMDSQQTAE